MIVSFNLIFDYKRLIAFDAGLFPGITPNPVLWSSQSR